jgi:hypothetical protein
MILGVWLTLMNDQHLSLQMIFSFFLGFANYFRNNILRYPKVPHSLDKVRNHRVFLVAWTAEHQHAFGAMKLLLASVRFFQSLFSKILNAVTDASN